MADRLASIAMQVVAKSLRSSISRIHDEVAVLVVAVLCSEHGARLVYPEHVTEQEAKTVLDNAVREMNEPKQSEQTTREIAELALLLATNEQVRKFHAAYCEALFAMRRCEHVLILNGAADNWVTAARTRADDWERNKTRHLSALIERALGPSGEAPDAAK